MDLNDLAAHLAQRQERQRSEATARMARYRAYLGQVDTLFTQVEGWLRPLRDQGLLAFRHPVLHRDCVIRSEPVVGLDVVLGRFSLEFAPLGPEQAGIELLRPLAGPPPRVLSVSLSPTHRAKGAFSPSLTLILDEAGRWQVAQGLSVPKARPFDEGFLATHLAQCLATEDAASRPRHPGGCP
ncbi:hypothetical protein [Geothrix edaphica]|uniref:Uncharacterized protein n=1 Tax=Geothrix edaphica TaxID=2927976 RepID=A0ABQ5PV27_9BACT|nr:hypothetical protein [Geothrix edaphica]GLH65991.1 hypothetical protein GETHED_03550 [Geothrix edaphica]